MSRSKFKWKCVILIYLVFVNVYTKSLPVYDKKLSSTIKNTDIEIAEVPYINQDSTTMQNIEFNTKIDTDIVGLEDFRSNLRTSGIRPNQQAERYVIELAHAGDGFTGRAVIDVAIGADTKENSIKFHISGLNIQSVKIALSAESSAINVGFSTFNQILEIAPGLNALFYVVYIEYTAQYKSGGHGFYRGTYDGGNSTYLAMNLHPTYARHVFPCMDEPTETAIIKFTYHDLDYNFILSNSKLEDNSPNEFRALPGPPFVWGMIAHNFININLPTADVNLYGRPGLLNQESQASVAINSFFNDLNQWTEKNYFEIILDQDGSLNIVGLPDISTDWHSLSTIGIWEPHLFMQINHSVKQRKTALYEIAVAMAKQWFGFVIIPQNWRHEWVTSGLASYAAYEVMKLFQDNPIQDVTLLDVNTLFVTDVIQESLLRDAYVDSTALEPDNDLFNENDIRAHINGLLKVKAPAFLRMMRLVLGDPDTDFIQHAARTLLNRNTLQTVSSLHLVDGINSEWLANGNGLIANVHDFLAEWKSTPGYPLLNIIMAQNTMLISQEHFSFGQGLMKNFPVPITFTTSVVPNFVDIQPTMVIDGSITIPTVLGEEDWVLFNIQGQGYYRVNYDNGLWNNIINALSNPETREIIHPLNRATLVDDALNLARAGKINYDIAFRVVLTMEHETEYAVWKAFVRNMEFLRKRLTAHVTALELDPDIYLRMVRRTILALENELGFEPEISMTEPAMHSLTRGLVMEHACKANYDPCVAAAIDRFYDPNNAGVVNPTIPHEIRPAVYCTMVREGDGDVIAALKERLEIEPTLYERVVILESLACSQDPIFINSLLDETIAANSPYSVEERSKIFAAVASSSYDNARLAFTFMTTNTAQIINTYGALEKFEELIYVLVDNMADNALSNDFKIWLNAQNNNLGASGAVSQRALLQVNQNLDWDDNHINDVYEWIDANNASTMVLSLAAICISLMVTLLNH